MARTAHGAVRDDADRDRDARAETQRLAVVARAQTRRASGGAPAAFGSALAEWSGTGDTEQRWRGRLAGVALNLILIWGSKPAGMISAIAPDGERPAELISLWVAPAARGRGVGDEAVRQVLTWVRREYPASRVVLSVKVDNDHAIRLYRRHGFVDAGVSPEDRDERLMRL